MQNKCPLSAPKNEKVAIENYPAFEWMLHLKKEVTISYNWGKKLFLAENKRNIQLFHYFNATK